MTTTDSSRTDSSRTPTTGGSSPAPTRAEQQLKPRSELTATELMRGVGALVLRMSEAEAAQLGDSPEDPDDDQTMIINMVRSTRRRTGCCA